MKPPFIKGPANYARTAMAASTPTITSKELEKRMAEPEPPPFDSPAAVGMQKRLFSDSSPTSSNKSPAGSATSSCDDTPKWRKILAAREEAEEDQWEKDWEASASMKSPEPFRSPAKTVFTHKAESGRTPDGAIGVAPGQSSL